MSNNDKDLPWYITELKSRQKIAPSPASMDTGHLPEWMKGAVSGEHGEMKLCYSAPVERNGRPPNETIPDEKQDRLVLPVHWDEWRNNFLCAVHTLICDFWSARPDIRVPCGTRLSYACEISSKREILNARIMQASGFPKLDELVLHTIKQFNGSELLEFPNGSVRTQVTQVGAMEVADEFRYDYTRFGDTERVVKVEEQLR